MIASPQSVRLNFTPLSYVLRSLTGLSVFTPPLERRDERTRAIHQVQLDNPETFSTARGSFDGVANFCEPVLLPISKAPSNVFLTDSLIDHGANLNVSVSPNVLLHLLTDAQFPSVYPNARRPIGLLLTFVADIKIT